MKRLLLTVALASIMGLPAAFAKARINGPAIKHSTQVTYIRRVLNKNGEAGWKISFGGLGMKGNTDLVGRSWDAIRPVGAGRFRAVSGIIYTSRDTLGGMVAGMRRIGVLFDHTGTEAELAKAVKDSLETPVVIKK